MMPGPGRVFRFTLISTTHERQFSTFGLVESKLHNRLGLNTATKLVYVYFLCDLLYSHMVKLRYKRYKFEKICKPRLVIKKTWEKKGYS